MTNTEWATYYRHNSAIRLLRQVLGWLADDAEQLLSEPSNEWAQKWLRGTIRRARAEAASAELESLLTGFETSVTLPPGKTEASDGKS